MRILLITFALLFTLNSFSQESIKIGFSNGLSISQLDFSTTTNAEVGYETRYGYSSRLYLEFSEHKYWSLNSGIGYIQKGGKDYLYYKPEGQPVEEYPMIVNLDYLTFDFQFKAKYSIKKFIPFITLGPKINYLVFGHPLDFVKDDINNIAYGFDYSAGISFDLDVFEFLIGYKGDYNMSYIHKSDDYEYTDNTSLIFFDILIPLNKCN